jgi:glucose-6-phosphate 1-dehydrogenase
MDGKEEDMGWLNEAVARTTAPDLKIPEGECRLETRPDPCTIVIIGASGDLCRRKLMPALFTLSVSGALPQPCLIVGCGRTRYNRSEFIEKMKASGPGDPDEGNQDRFWKQVHYIPVEYDDSTSYSNLSQLLSDLESGAGSPKNRIFYLAIPPSMIEKVVMHLGQAGLAGEGSRGNWARIVVEKPFGRDLSTAVRLDRTIHRYFNEHQVFRIDHYLAKETIQNILMFRFANAIFEPLWNRVYIEYVRISALEELGVEHRAGYYEQTGVLRDMFQNHMMQLLALSAMEPPSVFDTNQVRDEKSKVFRSLRPFSPESIEECLVLGQYNPGIVKGQPVPGYRQEPGVAPDSLTPTFAMLKVFVDNWRWQGVPFYLISGKRMDRKSTEIVIQFKTVPHSLFRYLLGEDILANRLTLAVYPEEKITLTFQTKNPGAKVCMRTVTMDFHYSQNFHGPVMDAYEKVLIDCMLGDQMLFWRQDGVELCWSFLTPVLKACETCGDRAMMLYPYAAGSGGPEHYVTAMGRL